MNDEQMQPLLEVWLRDRDEAPRDANGGIARVMTRVPQTRQRGRWWPLPAFHRRVQTPTATSTTDYRPSPIPATNGHAATVIGRTQTMLSPVKAITAGALVFALGGAMLIAQPFDQQGSVPSAEQGADSAAPVEVTGKLIDITCGGSAGTRIGLRVEDGRTTCEVDNEWSDPRLEGTETYTSNDVQWTAGSGLSIGHYTHDIVNDDGAWRMRPQFTFDSMDGPGNFSGTWVLDGEGAYEGLSVILAKDGLESVPLIGYIISTDVVPSAPEGASTP